jgi:hypothetical protein
MAGRKKAQIGAKALMSTNLGMIVWFLILGGLLWANFSTRKTFDALPPRSSAPLAGMAPF